MHVVSLTITLTFFFSFSTPILMYLVNTTHDPFLFLCTLSIRFPYLKVLTHFGNREKQSIVELLASALHFLSCDSQKGTNEFIRLSV
jgi:hypothetical protein